MLTNLKARLYVMGLDWRHRATPARNALTKHAWTTYRASIALQVPCDVCHGRGTLDLVSPEDVFVECPECAGHGQRRKPARLLGAA
jgi:hypothetical protein